MGPVIPPEYGGRDTPILDVILVIEEVARACGVTARIVVEGNLGVVGALRAYGTEAQKRRYFPWIVLEGERTKLPRCSATCSGIGSNFGGAAIAHPG